MMTKKSQQVLSNDEKWLWIGWKKSQSKLALFPTILIGF